MAHSAGLSNTNFYYVTAQGGYYLIPPPAAQSDAAPLPQIPAMPNVDAIGRLSLQPRPALTPLQNLRAEPLVASPHIPVGLEKMLTDKVAELRRLASLRAHQGENTGLSATLLVQPLGSPISNPSNLFYTRLPTSRVPAPMLRGELPPIQRPPLPQQGAVPAAAVQALPQQQAQPPASERADLKRRAPEPATRPLDFRHRTQESFRVSYDARKPRTQPGLPEPQPVVTPAIPAPRKRSAHPKPAAATLDFKEALTPKNYQAERAKARRDVIEPYYESSKEALDASEWISEAEKFLHAEEYTEAVTAIHRAFKKLPHDGFVYKLFDNTPFDTALSLHSDRRICTSDPEEDVDVLVLRGIRKIKHGNYEAAKTDLQKVLNQKPNDSLARLIYDHACQLIDRTLQAALPSTSAEATNYDSVKLG